LPRQKLWRLPRVRRRRLSKLRPPLPRRFRLGVEDQDALIAWDDIPCFLEYLPVV